MFFEQITQSAKSDAAKALASIGKLKAEQIRYYIERYEKTPTRSPGCWGRTV
jgi:hypothetical protein